MMQIRKLTLACLLMFGGCVTVHQQPGMTPRLQLSVPAAAAADSVRVDYHCPQGHDCVTWTNIPVLPERCYLDLPEKRERDGNTYTIEFMSSTNVSYAPGMPEYDDMVTYCLTNRWPAKRNHIDLSIDNGTNYIRRIGYGIPVSASRYGGEMKWSPPKDFSLLTEQAKLRITNLNGSPFDNGPTNFACNVPPGKYVESFGFALCGAVIDAPAWNAITYYTGPLTMTFRQAGGGAVWNVGWIAPDDLHFHTMGTLSNVVAGLNTVTISNSIPRAPEVELVIWSASDRVIKGYSKPFAVE
jgi:hypothetical protein